jgi:HEAT repeat protein
LQTEIINALIQIEDGDVVAICKRHIGHPYAGVRAACVRGLYRAGKADAGALLVEALKDDNVEVRNSSAMFLGWLEFSGAIPSLLHVAAADGDIRVRKSALQALENIRDQGAVLPLMRLLNDDSREIRDKVVVTLERITGEVISLGGGDDAKARVAEVTRLKEWWIRKKHEVANGHQPQSDDVAASETVAADVEVAQPDEPVDAPISAGEADATSAPSVVDEQDGTSDAGKKRARRR